MSRPSSKALSKIGEIIANALDEQALTGTPEPQTFWDGEGSWHIRDWARAGSAGCLRGTRARAAGRCRRKKHRLNSITGELVASISQYA